MCSEDECFDGFENIERAMREYKSVESISCDMLQDNCYYLEKINKAACRYSCMLYSRLTLVVSLIAGTE